MPSNTVTRKVEVALFLAASLLKAVAAPDASQHGAALPGPVAGPRLTEPLTTGVTIKPVFSWTPTERPGRSFDLIICVAKTNSDGLWVPGKAVYYRQGLTNMTHTIGQPLLPNTVYVWSVRSRAGKSTSKWAAYNDSNPTLFPRKQLHYDIFWPFKTQGN